MATNKTSRYRSEPAVAGPDARGRLTLAHTSRPLPAVTGTFRHVLADGDRIDQLADKYYGDPLAWWQICDANPEFLSPWAMLGQEPVISAAFTIIPAAYATWEVLWARLFQVLTALPGVERVTIAASPDPDERPPQLRILVTYNRLTRPAPLNKVITENGFSIDDATLTTRVGKQIVIPPVEGG